MLVMISIEHVEDSKIKFDDGALSALPAPHPRGLQQAQLPLPSRKALSLCDESVWVQIPDVYPTKFLPILLEILPFVAEVLSMTMTNPAAKTVNPLA
jgi:hypothetical protein